MNHKRLVESVCSLPDLKDFADVRKVVENIAYHQRYYYNGWFSRGQLARLTQLAKEHYGLSKTEEPEFGIPDPKVEDPI